MKSKFFLQFFIFLFGFFIGNLFPTFFGQLLGSTTSFFLLLLFESLNLTIHCLKAVGFALKNEAGTAAESDGVSGMRRSRSSGMRRSRNVSDAVVRAQVPIISLNRKEAPDWISLRCIRFREAFGPVCLKILNTHLLNSIKIGILFGLFVDAFKVGS
jgi:hypothetical protein